MPPSPSSHPAVNIALFLKDRALRLAGQARQRPETARIVRNWLALAARRANSLGLPALAGRIAGLEQSIL